MGLGKLGLAMPYRDHSDVLVVPHEEANHNALHHHQELPTHAVAPPS